MPAIRSTFPAGSALNTDLYQLTMLQGYFAERMDRTAVFEFFVRSLPPGRNFLVCAGLEQVIDYLEDFRFAKDELEWLGETGHFRADFLDYLGGLRFTGEVHAMAEGTVFFPEEPILRITAPLPEAQIVETRLINLLHFQTLIASKAARCVLAAGGRNLMDFGLRRAHGAEAGLLAARATCLAGFASTSNVEAGRRFGIPISGTMAHSFVQAHPSEEAAFLAFARANPNAITFLIDTFDTEAAAQKVVGLALQLKSEGLRIQAVRLDSGDLAQHARRVRAILDHGGLRDVRIVASGNLDEQQILALSRGGVPIDGFGVGTRLDVSADRPYLDCAYKIQEYDGRALRKKSEGKATWPGRKQVWREYDSGGGIQADRITLAEEKSAGQPLLQPWMKAGRRLHASPSLKTVREHAQQQLAMLSSGLRNLESHCGHPVEISGSLQDLARLIDSRTANACVSTH